MIARVLAVVVVAGCGPAKLTPPDGPAQPTALVERFVGRIAMTPTVPFGGGTYCKYLVTLKDVLVDVSVHPVDGLVTMVIEDTMVEEIDGTCAYPPLAMNRHAFEHRGGPQLPTGTNMFSPTLEGIATNKPKVEATTTVTREKDTRLTAMVTWHRTDIGAPLDWTVMTPIPIILDRVTCVAGDTYCLGGSVEGSEYACGDGVRLYELATCPAGCGPTLVAADPHEDEHCK